MANPQAADGVKKLIQVFVDKGYALKASVEPVQFSATKPGGKLRVSYRFNPLSTWWSSVPTICYELLIRMQVN